MGLAYIDSSSTPVVTPSALSCSSARIPSSLWSGGIRMSRTTRSTSGCSVRATCRPGTSVASATTSHPPEASSCRTPSRTSTASSTTSTRGLSTLIVRGFRRRPGGMVATTVVPSAPVLRSSRPPRASTRSTRPRRPVPWRVERRPAVAVVTDGDADRVRQPDLHGRPRGTRVLGDVGQALRDHEVHGGGRVFVGLLGHRSPARGRRQASAWPAPGARCPGCRARVRWERSRLAR